MNKPFFEPVVLNADEPSIVHTTKNEFEPFLPIEKRLPCWLMARVIVESCMPDHLKFKAFPEQNSAWLDFGFADEVMALVPEEDCDAMKQIILEAGNALEKYIPADLFKQFVHMPITQRTMAAMNETIARFDRENERAGAPTTMDVMRHYLGLKPADRPFHSVFS